MLDVHSQLRKYHHHTVHHLLANRSFDGKAYVYIIVIIVILIILIVILIIIIVIRSFVSVTAPGKTYYLIHTNTYTHFCLSCHCCAL